MPGIDKYAEDRKKGFEKMATVFQGLNPSEFWEPDFYEISEMLKKPEEAEAKKAELTKMCFNYCMEHREDVYRDYSYNKLKAVVMLMGVLNNVLAFDFEDKLNNNKNLESKVHLYQKLTLTSKENERVEVIETGKDRDALELEWLPSNNDEFASVDLKKDPRFHNLDILYKHLTSKKMDSIFYDTAEYKAMLASIKHAVDYAKLKDTRIDADVAEEMLKDVSKATTKYIEAKKTEPSSDLGKARLEAAFAVLYSVDRKQTNKLLEANTQAKVDRLQHFRNMMTGMFEPKGPKVTEKDVNNLLSIDQIVKNTKIKFFFSREDKLYRMEKRLNEMKAALENTENKNILTYRIQHLPKYIALKDIYDQAKVLNDADLEKFNISQEMLDKAAERFSNSSIKTEIMRSCIMAEKKFNPDDVYEKYAAAKNKLKNLEKELNEMKVALSDTNDKTRFKYRLKNLPKYIALKGIYEDAKELDDVKLGQLQITDAKVEAADDEFRSSEFMKNLLLDYTLSKPEFNPDEIYEKYVASKKLGEEEVIDTGVQSEDIKTDTVNKAVEGPSIG